MTYALPLQVRARLLDLADRVQRLALSVDPTRLHSETSQLAYELRVIALTESAMQTRRELVQRQWGPHQSSARRNANRVVPLKTVDPSFAATELIALQGFPTLTDWERKRLLIP